MKKILNVFISSRTMAFLLAIFAISIATATIIEKYHGTAAARYCVYNAKWFEILLLLGCINIIGMIFRYKLYRREKLTLLLFHVAFILIIIGAGVTRYFGFEGIMHIREGETSNSIISEDTYLQLKYQKGGITRSYSEKVMLSPLSANRFRKTIDIDGKSLKISSVNFISNAVPTLQPDDAGGPVLEMVISGVNGRQNVLLKQGEAKKIGGIVFNFGANTQQPQNEIEVYFDQGDLFYRAPFDVSVMNMSTRQSVIDKADSTHPFLTKVLYNFHNVPLVLNNFLPAGSVRPVVSQNGNGNTLDALDLDIESNGISRNVTLWGRSGVIGEPVKVPLDEGETLTLSYGSRIVKIPFSIKLNDFIVKRYPGSNSPSWFESKVVLIDKSENIDEPRRIYMNNILKYRGFRFFQSSYDPDEMGTILSVNYDFAGTWITYFGYMIMALGMILSIFNKNSRFRNLIKKSAEIRQARQALTVATLFVVMALPANATLLESKIVNSEIIPADQARLFGGLLVQDNGGRIMPVNTLSSEILRKVARKISYKGLNSDQVLMGMMTDPYYWQHQPIIHISNPDVRKTLGLKDKDAPFSAFFSTDGNYTYLLRDYVNEAYRKKPVNRDKFDNEMIRLDERVNVCYMVYTYGIMKLFPVPGDINHSWLSPASSDSMIHTEDTVFIKNILPYYLEKVKSAIITSNWKEADDLLNSMKLYQKKYGSEILPSERKVKLEIFYNNSNIFLRVSYIYGIVGFVLLILQFIGIFYVKLKLRIPVLIAEVLIIVGFIAHFAGLILRWYIAGHAPWSNGFEALTYIAWATVLAGIIFVKRSSVTLSATAILAFLILFVAHMSWMDPEITNLVPVLKSYWLVIHVAVITASYGFLALAALLSTINLLLMLFVSNNNKNRVSLTLKELTNISEMTLIIGLYMITIGTFLGGVWANESWGRYWGWDPKETWALVTVIVYAFVAHMRLVPGLKGIFAFNLAALLGYGSVIMTYFGVNYYLAGMHSYAKGDAAPVPSFVYYTLIIITIVVLIAYRNYKKHITEDN